MKKNHGKIGQVMQVLCTLPLVVLGCVILLMTYWQSAKLLRQEVHNELKTANYMLCSTFNSMYPGDYSLSQKGEGLSLQKGRIDITTEYDLFDSFKEMTGYEVALYYEDTLVLSTIVDKQGKRLIGIGANNKVMEEVITSATPTFYDKVLINRSEYYAYYAPLTNMDGSTVGMLMVGRPCAQVIEVITNNLYPFLAVIVLFLILSSLLVFLYTRRFHQVIDKLQSFLKEVSGGNLNAVLSPSVTRRNDEFGVIGRSVVSMQDSLRHMLELDALTRLFNRHFGNRKLAQVMQKNEEAGTCFALAIGDIDFFKKVNDTYGHDAGDVILQNVANVLRDSMLTNGFVVRWGGEEFLLVFDKMNMYQAADELEKILDKVRAMETVYEEQTIKVTMTFGIAESHGQSQNELIKEADEKLYHGKQGGRNRVVV